jgi:drug/metabolite transporter (DMT)-like permease
VSRVHLPFLLVLLFCGMSWGSSQVLGKIAVSTGHQHLGLIFWQFVLGALLLGALMLARGKRLVLTRESLRFALIIAVIGTIIPGMTFYYSITHLPAGIMSILISSVPLLSFPIALALGMDRLGAARSLGLLCGIGGVLLIALPETSLPDPAMVAFIPIALIGPFFYAIEANYVARGGMAGMDALQAMCLSSILGAGLVLPAALATGLWIDPFAQAWGAAESALVASAVIHALAYASYVWLASNAGAVFAAQTAYIVTGTGVLWAMLLLGERFSGWIWAALALMILGLALVTPRPRIAPVLQEAH